MKPPSVVEYWKGKNRIAKERMRAAESEAATICEKNHKLKKTIDHCTNAKMFYHVQRLRIDLKIMVRDIAIAEEEPLAQECETLKMMLEDERRKQYTID